jgi:hypothetical protein
MSASTKSLPQVAQHRSDVILFAALLGAIGLNGLLMLGLSACGLLPLCWIGSLLILIGLAALKCRLWKSSATGEWKELSSAWLAPWPWIIGVLLAIQIFLYPPTMSDSLSYRLPRLFLALQEGGIGRFATADDRMNGMPWGWEMLALPFASLNALNATKIINLACWAITFQLLFALARQRETPAPRARWIALALSTPPVFLLQAASTANDLYAATLLLIGVWMIHRFAQTPGPIPVLASLLSLALATNAKPQFLVLGLPWLLWWVLAPGKPWKQVPWHILAIAAPFYFLVSPLWLMFENHQLTGNLLGWNESVGITEKASAPAMIAAGTIQFTVAQFQLPVFPGAETFSSVLRKLPGFAALNEAVPKFNPGVQMLTIVDGASIGLVHAALIIMGVILCLRSSPSRYWPWIVAFLFGIAVAASQVVPATIGRSFVGFFSLLIPLAAIGLAHGKRPVLTQTACIAAVLIGCAAMVLNPSAPLWPSQATQSFAEKRKISGLVSSLQTYNGYKRRAATGIGILTPVPPGETVGILLRRVTPASTLWQPDWTRNRIEFLHHIDPDTFANGSVRWLVVADNAAEFLPEVTARYSQLPGWQSIRKIEYLSNMRQGPETWTLYRKNDP